MIVSISSDVNIIVYPEIWEMMTADRIVEEYPFLPMIIIIGIANNIILIVWSLLVVLFLFTRNKYFPIFTVSFLVYCLVVVIIDFALTNSISIKIFPNESKEFSDLVLTNLIESVIITLIWVPYFLVSKNVKSVFKETEISMDSV